MMEKKIATSVDVLINVAQWEHLQITKYAEKKITYENEEDMVKQEDQLTDELVKDIIRTMRSLPDKLGKKTNAVASIEEKIQKKIPTWLEEGAEPNIANTAKVNADKAVAKANAEAEQKKVKEETLKSVAQADTDALFSEPEKASSEQPKDSDKDDNGRDLDDSDLFDDEDLFKT